MATKQINTRVSLKTDTSENWAKATGFSPLKGEAVVYQDPGAAPQVKIGDGETNVNDLPFATVDWNDLINKPFGEGELETYLSWSGYTSGLVSDVFLGTNIYRIGDYISEETLVGSTALMSDGTTVEYTSDNTQYWDDGFFESKYLIMVPYNNYSIDSSVYGETVSISTAGCYHIDPAVWSGVYIKQLMKSTVETIDEKYIPDTIARKTSPITTEGDGVAYTATVPGITELTVGQWFIMIPNVTSTSMNVTLNVNGLGAKYIKQPLSLNTSATANGAIASWLVINRPVMVMYNGTYWVTHITRPEVSSLYGTVPVSKGGIPVATTDDNGKILKVVEGEPVWETADTSSASTPTVVTFYVDDEVADDALGQIYDSYMNGNTIIRISTGSMYTTDIEFWFEDGGWYGAISAVAAGIKYTLYQDPSGACTWSYEEVIYVPTCTTSDNGKFLQVVDGKPTWVSIPNAEEASF